MPNAPSFAFASPLPEARASHARVVAASADAAIYAGRKRSFAEAGGCEDFITRTGARCSVEEFAPRRPPYSRKRRPRPRRAPRERYLVALLVRHAGRGAGRMPPFKRYHEFYGEESWRF